MSVPESLVELVRSRARQQPNRALFVGCAAQRTWAEFEARSNRGAHVLRRLGLHYGERAAILAANCSEWMEVFFAVHKAGGVVVPINERLTPGERQRLLDDAGVSLLIGEPERLATTDFPAPKLALGPEYERQLAEAAADAPDTRIRSDDLAVIAYTSGTTGVPKGVMWSHGALCWSAQGNPFPAAVAGGRRILVCAPLYAGGAILMACNALAIGATTVVAPFTPAGTLQTLVEQDIEFTGLVPTMIGLLVDAAPAGWGAPHLRRIYYGAGTMTSQLFLRAERLFGCEFQQCYGMTETCIGGTRLDPADHRPDALDRLASAGKPMPGVELKVVDENGMDVAAGTVGEVVIRSPGNMLGYWRRPERNREVFRDGWYRTRDIGRLDGNGYLYLVDRKDDMVKSGGLNVSPAEVEHILVSHPAVAEAAVIGVPDERWGERVTAVVRTRKSDALSESDLVSFCRSQLADYKSPRSIIFTDTPLPRTGLGKISRQTLRMRYGGK